MLIPFALKNQQYVCHNVLYCQYNQDVRMVIHNWGSILRHQCTFVIYMEKTFQWSVDKTGSFMASFLPYCNAYKLYHQLYSNAYKLCHQLFVVIVFCAERRT